MLRALQNLPKVLRGQVPCSGNTVSSSLPQHPPVLLEVAENADNIAQNNLGLCVRSPGHIRVPSWLPSGNHQWFLERFHHVLEQSQREFNQKRQSQSNRGQHSSFEALGWGTAVVVAIQLCRALSVARFPDNESYRNFRPSLIRAAHLLPIPPSYVNTARHVSKHSDSDKGSGSSFSVSFGASEEESLESISSSPQGDISSSQDLSSRRKLSSQENASCIRDATKVESKNILKSVPGKDIIIPALESAMSQLDKVHQRSQGMVHTMMGVQYLRLGHYEKAVTHFEYACELGYSKAQFNLGLCYELGKGVKSNSMKAASLYQAAAEQGHPLALYNLGVYYYHGFGGIPQNEADGIKYMEKAAVSGVIQAHSFLGNYYLQAGSRDIGKAILHLKTAAKEEDIESQYLLGLCYEQGWGVHKSLKKAGQLYYNAAEGGYPLAMYSLGLYYEKGLGGVLRDSVEARRLFEKASESGLELAQEKIEKLSAEEIQQRLTASNKVMSSTGSKSFRTHEKSEIVHTRVSDTKNNNMHVSNSEPSLHGKDRLCNKTNRNGNLLQLSYLTLILPSLLHGKIINTVHHESESEFDESQVSFQIGEDEDSTCSSTQESMESLQLSV